MIEGQKAFKSEIKCWWHSPVDTEEMIYEEDSVVRQRVII